MRAFDSSLRGIKIAAFLFAGVATLLVTSNGLTRPTHAEGPLTKTVKCLVNTLLFAPCQVTPDPTSPSSNPSSSQTPPTTPASNSSANSAPSGASTSTGSATTGSPQSSQLLTSPAPLTVDTPKEIAAMPQTPQRSFNNPKSYDYVAFFNTSSPYAHSAVQGDANAFIQPSNEGWKMAGMAWYWWIGIIAAITGAIWGVRQVILRRSTLLSKP